MKPISNLVIPFFLSTLCVISFAQESKSLKTKVTEATLFSDRAMITREGSINLPEGRFELVLSNLPSELNDESVRVSGKGTGEVKILDVKVETEFTAEIQEKEIQKLHNKTDSLQLEDKTAQDNIAVLESQKNFIESLKAEAASEINRNVVINKPNTSDWQNLLTFLGRNLTQIYEDSRKENLKRKRIEAETNVIRRKINQTRSERSRNYKLIKVSVLVQKAGSIRLKASYLVNNASWHSIYDARVSLETKKLELTYYGMVQQSTGEDWNNIHLILSTAQPFMAQALPDLQPLYLDVGKKVKDYVSSTQINNEPRVVSFRYRSDRSMPTGYGSISGRVVDSNTGESLVGVNCLLEGTTLGATTDLNGDFRILNIPGGNYRLQVSYIGYRDTQAVISVKEKEMLNINISLQPSALEYSEVISVTAEAPHVDKRVSYSLAEVQDEGISAVFKIPTMNTIPSDNTPHKVTITIEPLDVSFEYMAVPKASEKTFLKGKFANQTEYPLLAGPVSVFVENEFVNKSHIQTIVPNDSSELALGIDDGIKVSRKLINKFSESKGIFGGKKKVTFEFEIEITNTKRTEVQVEVIDQLPISRNEKVKIELLRPDEKEIKRDKQNRITWNLALIPGATITLPLKYQIEFPEDSKVTGLE